MYISQRTIEKVQQTAEIKEVIEKYISLKKKGKSYQACCPFHDEKTPSFYVTPDKNIYKCFGCGEAGTPIQFVIKKENCSFPEAIKSLANFYNIEVEYDQKEENKEKVEDLKQMQLLTAAGSRKYFNYLYDLPIDQEPVKELLENRKLEIETIVQFQIGFAPDDWKFLTSKIIDKGLYNPALQCGIIRTKNGNSYDFFRNRLMFPIHDQNGVIVGFGGRKLSSDQDKENPKYINSPDSDLYKKDRVLYGLNFAKQGIKKSGKAILVEGYYDVISFHQNELDNAVAPCGTALTLSQAKLLKRYTDKVIIIFDGDKAGVENALKAINVCVESGLKTEVFLLPKDEDPDSFCSNFSKYVVTKIDDKSGEIQTFSIKNHIYSRSIDAIQYKIDKLLGLALSPDEIENALNEISHLLILIDGEYKLEHYIQYIYKTYKIKPSILNYKVIALRKSEEGDDNIISDQAFKYIPKVALEEDGNNPEKDLAEYGFFEMKNRYYSMKSTGNGYRPASFSNFTMKILFHLSSEKIPRRLIEISHFKGEKITVDTPTTNLTSIGKFKEFIEGVGSFNFNGDQGILNKIKEKLYDMEKKCKQIDVLGWHPDGFWVFSNCLMNAKVVPLDDNGIAHYNNVNYYIPSGNKNYADQLFRFANEKRFRHINSPITFEKWAHSFVQVYKEPGMMGLCFAISCIFSDVIFHSMTGFPLMFLYGEGGSGKGSLIKSIQHLFGKPQDPLTLSGKANTDKAKIAIFAQYVNSVICLEEYRNGNEDIENLLKALWDRYGYSRRRMDSGVGTESVPISSGVIVTGNDYPSSDPLLQRLLVLEINENTRSQEAVDNYNHLKEIEDLGITSVLLELLQLRKAFEETYKENHKETFRDISKMLANVKVTDRMKNNLTVLIASYKIVARILKFPFTIEQLLEYAQQSIIKQNEKRDTGGEVQTFWDVFISLLSNRSLTHGREFKVSGNKVYIRYKEIHNKYLPQHFTMFRSPGLRSTTLLDKLVASEAFIEKKNSERFDGELKSSCHVFDYSKIGAQFLHIIDYNDLKSGPNPEFMEMDKIKEDLGF